MPQKIKNKPFRIKKKGKIKVKTDNKGNNFGAKKGKTYARNVNIARTIFKPKITLLNHESCFILLIYQANLAIIFLL